MSIDYVSNDGQHERVEVAPEMWECVVRLLRRRQGFKRLTVYHESGHAVAVYWR